MRVLSIVIPSYNTELYLKRCLDSLLYHKDLVKKLDIIIVNDGSKDATPKIAEEYQKKYPSAIQFINKKNGGHGSTINAGIKVARGKYFKVLDSDDWFNFFDFSAYISALESENSDIIITNYKQDILYDESTIDFTFNNSKKPSHHPLSDAIKIINEPDFFFQFSMHSMTVKTSNLKKVWGDGLLEHTFYVDQQYVAKVLQSAKDYTTYNLDIYRYFIGRPEQSVSSGGFFNHRQDHERVLRWLLQTFAETEDPTLKVIFEKQILSMLNTHYDIYYTPALLEPSQKSEIIEFDKYIAVNYSAVHQNIPAAKALSFRLSPARKLKIAKAAGFVRRNHNG